MDTERSDQQLVTDYLAGDEQSLEILIKRYLKPVYGFVFRCLAGDREADDVTQEVFLKVWRHLNDFDRGKSFKTWIFSIARNAAIDSLKKKKSVPFSAFENSEGENIIAETLADPAPLPDEISGRRGLAETIGGFLGGLSEKYRTVLHLRYGGDFTFQEIADTLGESLNTVKSRHRRAVIILRKRMGQNRF